LATRTPHLAARLGLALLFFFALDALAFRTGYYATILKPESTAGFLQTFIWIEQHRPKTYPRQALAVGDSRVGLKVRIADSLTPETGLQMGTLAVPGTTPRCWYYMLREMDPHADRYDAIAIGLDRYEDRSVEDLSERELDINYLTPLVGFRDLPTFAFSYPSWPLRLHAAEAVLFKGLVLQRDVQDFLAYPRTRLQIAALQHRSAHEWQYNSVWERHSFEGIQVDWNSHTIVLPDWLNGQQRKSAEELLLADPPPHSEAFAQYRRRWLGAILDRYRRSRTKIIFYRLPRGPVVRPGITPDAGSSIRAFAAAGKALLMDADEFDSLERPELFGDPLHLNEAGGIRFSTMLARAVSRMLSQAQPANTRAENR
jgi:hypothetical protein